MDTRDKLLWLTQQGMSAAKIGEPLHRSTISKWLTGERNISQESEEMIARKIKKFKEEVIKFL